jgi:hypothetical protein
MKTLAQPKDSGTDPLPPPGTTPYFRRLHAAIEQEAARLGLPPEPWGA